MFLGVEIGVGTFFGLGALSWRPRTLDLESFTDRNVVFKFLFWQIVDRTSPGFDMSKIQLVESWYDSSSPSLLILVLVDFFIMGRCQIIGTQF